MTIIVQIPPEVSYKVLEFQKPDGLEVLRKLPLIDGLIPSNINPVEGVAGRQEMSNVFLVSTEHLPLGVKFDLPYKDIILLGVMPVRYTEGSELYECTVDAIEGVQYERD